MSRSVLVTGAARGIGAAIAQRLATDGWQVHAVDAALERFDGRLDAVVANAGYQHVASVRDFPEERPLGCFGSHKPSN